MAYQNGKTYYIIPTCATGDAAYNQKILNKEVRPLALNTAGVSASHYNKRNVNVYSLDWGTDMQWKVELHSGFARILCAGNPSYGLDYYYGNDNPGNCDIYQISGNDEDSKINFRTINASENLYKLQCYRNNVENDLYLTVMPNSSGSFTNGCDVRWQPLDASKATQQTWWLVPIEDVSSNNSSGSGNSSSTSKTLPLVETVNQYYKDYNEEIRQRGCALCTGLMISKFYGSSANNNVEYFYNNYWGAYGYNWNSPNANISAAINYTYPAGDFAIGSDMLAAIKAEIDADKPVAVHAYVVYPNGKDSEHWVVAYGYTNNAATADDILVADPFNSDTSSTSGRLLNLKEAYSRFKTNTFDRMRTSTSK